MPIILKDKKCCDCGKDLPQVHPATKRCEGCKEVQKQAKLKVLVETYKPKKSKFEVAAPKEEALCQDWGKHWVTIYGMPRNPHLRFIEFKDGSHGTVAVRADSTLRTGMKVEVERQPGAAPHLLVGRYNRWGTRVK